MHSSRIEKLAARAYLLRILEKFDSLVFHSLAFNGKNGAKLLEQGPT
jgi:hypothetical protein